MKNIELTNKRSYDEVQYGKCLYSLYTIDEQALGIFFTYGFSQM